MNITGDLSRSAASPTLDTETHHSDDVANPGNIVDNNHLELVPYQKEITVDEEKPSSDPRALVPLPSLEAEALAIVPLNQKPKRTELAQRRTRRPFSVTEVEALVQAVEELGTGRYIYRFMWFLVVVLIAKTQKANGFDISHRTDGVM